MDVHPTKNGINRYWPIPISLTNLRPFGITAPWFQAAGTPPGPPQSERTHWSAKAALEDPRRQWGEAPVASSGSNGCRCPCKSKASSESMERSWKKSIFIDLYSVCYGYFDLSLSLSSKRPQRGISLSLSGKFGIFVLCRKKHVGFELWLVWLGMSSYTSVQPLSQTSFWQPVAFRNINLQQARKNGEFAINSEDTKILENLLHRTIQYSRTPEFKNLYAHTNTYWLLWIYVFMLDTIYQKISNQLRANMSNLIYWSIHLHNITLTFYIHI